MAGQTPAQQNPTILIKEIKDQYLRKNFQNISDYFSGQNQFLNFKFFEIDISAATDSGLIAHGLGVLPKDINVMFISGPGQITFDLDASDSINLAYSTTDAVYCRIFIGSYWGNQSSNAAPGKMTLGVTPASDIVIPDFLVPTTQIFTTTGAQTYLLPKKPRKPLYLEVLVVGGGGGGSGGAAGPASIGVDSSFGGTILVGKAGNPGLGGNAQGGAGGIATSTLTNNPQLTPGGSGTGGFVFFASGGGNGGPGGPSALGGAGGGGANGVAGQAAAANTGGGGGGGGAPGVSTGGGGGGGAGYAKGIIASPADTYALVVGAGGAVSGNGGKGGDGIIIVIEHYQ